MFEIIIKSTIIGLLMGASISAGAVRMFKAPTIQGMGAFRTLGEMNACNGDSISHFTFGFGFFITSAAAALGTGSLTQDVLHRVIPNWSAAVVNMNKKNDYRTKTFEMTIVGALIGAIVFILLNTASSLVPVKLANIAKDILTPAATNMINIVMPLLFLWAAIDAGKKTGIFSIFFGGLMAMISGNALPGIIFGILTGSLVEEIGYKDKNTISMFLIVIIMIILIAYFRNIHLKVFELFN